MKRRPLVRYSREDDAIYIRFADGKAVRTHDIDDLRMVNYAADGSVIGIESLDVSAGVDLSEAPYPHDVSKAMREAGINVLAESDPLASE